MAQQFASFRVSNDNATYTVTGGGATTASSSLWYSIAFANLAGFNRGSVLQQVNVAAGEQLTVSFPNTLLESGELPERIYLLAADADSSNLRRVIAYTDVRDENGDPYVSIPDIVLGEDEHFILEGSAADAAALTAIGSEKVPGQRLLNLDTGFIYQYEPDSTQTPNDNTVIAADTLGNWVQVTSFIGDVVETSGLGGSDQRLTTIVPADVIQDITYDFDGSPGRKTGYWLLNESGADLQEGTKISLQVLLNGVAVSNLFKNKLQINLKGYVDQSTGVLDTSISGAGSVFAWNPQNVTQLVLSEPLPSGVAIYYEIWLQTSATDFVSPLPPGSDLSLSLTTQNLAAIEVPFATLTGDYISSEADQRRIVPDIGLAVDGLPGRSIVDNLMSTVTTVTPVAGLAPDVAGQKVIIDGTGDIEIESPSYVPSRVEAQRALVGTLAGDSKIVQVGSSIALSGSQSVSITVNHPVDSNGAGTIRADYPDSLLAGYFNAETGFNPTLFKIYLDDGSTIYEVDNVAVLPQPTQTFSITTASQTVATLPASPPNDFSLYEVLSGSTVASSGGSIPAGTYDVYAAYQYNGNQVTSISHEASDGNLPTFLSDFSELLQLAQCFGCVRSDYQALRDFTNRTPWFIASVRSTGTFTESQEIWGYDPTSLDDDDNETSLLPTGQAPTTPGRWKLTSGGNDSDEVLNTTGELLVSSNDTTLKFLEDKISVGPGLAIETLNDGADESLEIQFTSFVTLTAPRTYYVSDTGTRTTWDLELEGTTVADPDVFPDLQTAISLITSSAFLGPFDVTIEVLSGVASGFVAGDYLTTGGVFNIQGASAGTPVSDPGTGTLIKIESGIWNITGLTRNGSAPNYLVASGDSTVTVTVAVVQSTVNDFLVEDSATVILGDNVSVFGVGSKDSFATVTDNGRIIVDTASIIFFNNFSVNEATLVIRDNGLIKLPPSLSWTTGGGVVTGDKLNISGNATLIDQSNNAGTGVIGTGAVDNTTGNTELVIFESPAAPSGGGGGTSLDESVKVSANDTTAGFLAAKLVAGTGVTLTETNDGANESLTIDVTVTGGGGGISSPFIRQETEPAANLDISWIIPSSGEIHYYDPNSSSWISY